MTTNKSIVNNKIQEFSELLKIMLTGKHKETIQKALHESTPTDCSGNLMISVEETIELSIEIIKQIMQQTNNDKTHLIEEWSDNFMSLSYIFIGLNYDISEILDLKDIMLDILISPAPIGDFIRVSFQTTNNYVPNEKLLLAAIHSFQNTNKIIIKYLRHKCTKKDMLPYLQRHLIILFAIKAYFNLSTDDIIKALEKKASPYRRTSYNPEILTKQILSGYIKQNLSIKRKVKYYVQKI